MAEYSFYFLPNLKCIFWHNNLIRESIQRNKILVPSYPFEWLDRYNLWCIMGKYLNSFLYYLTLIYFYQNYGPPFVEAGELRSQMSDNINITVKSLKFDTSLNHLIVDRETGNVSGFSFSLIFFKENLFENVL